MTHSKVEDEDVGGVSHRLVEDHNKNNKQVPDEADDDDEGEQNRNHNGNHSHQDLKMLLLYFLLS